MRKQLLDLRREMARRGIDACYIPTTDPHGSEYVHEHFKFRAYVSGFTGSAGTLVVTRDAAKLWTDGRYFLQAERQLADSGIDLMREETPGTPSVEAYLQSVLPPGSRLAFDGRVVRWPFGRFMAERYEVCDIDLADAIWPARPAIHPAPIYELPLRVTGQSMAQKLAAVRQDMEALGADFHLISSLEEIAWLTNLRGADVVHTPVFFAFALVGRTEMQLFLMDGALPDALRRELEAQGVRVRPYDEIDAALAALLPGMGAPTGGTAPAGIRPCAGATAQPMDCTSAPASALMPCLPTAGASKTNAAAPATAHRSSTSDASFHDFSVSTSPDAPISDAVEAASATCPCISGASSGGASKLGNANVSDGAPAPTSEAAPASDTAPALLLDEAATAYALVRAIPAGVRRIDGRDLCLLRKAQKNPTEIRCTREAHLRDGLAVTTFLYLLKQTVDPAGAREPLTMTEMDAADLLLRQRQAQPGFSEPSFTTIAGYAENGAIVHYEATPETNKTLLRRGLLLVDSGGQYDCGTTDITRTIALGPLTEAQKLHYTAVLKGHIALATAVFPPGTRGDALDALARRSLRALGLDYNHGTGHGVGHLLSVHEGPARLSFHGGDEEVKPGMILSDEPGVYLPGRYGIRLENEVLCRTRADGMLEFETLTLCPWERGAILPERLTPAERDWVDSYHRRVRETLSPHLPADVAEWLRRETAPLE